MSLTRKLKLYQTSSKYYLVGENADRKTYKVLNFTRVQGHELDVHDGGINYSKDECDNLISSIDAGNRSHGGAVLVLQADALIGCFRFLEAYYLLFVVKKKYVGTMCGAHKVYSVADIRIVSLQSPEVYTSTVEQRYRKLLSGVELTKNFYFSYTWPVWRTVQAGLSDFEADDPWASMFVWNSFLTRPLRVAVSSDGWVMPLIHGHWQQRSLALAAQNISITLIARRSKYFAGTRYRKRGTNDQGHVANDVETEQVVSVGLAWGTDHLRVSSVVQVRGSIPLFWTQDSYGQHRLKPEILLQRFDPLYEATRLHFENLTERYGGPLMALNLLRTVEKEARESLLGKEYNIAVTQVNRQRQQNEKIIYKSWDFKKVAKQKNTRVLTRIMPTVAHSLEMTGFFLCAPPASSVFDQDLNAPKKDSIRFQQGVLRTNCIDCLDRTNVAQYALGLMALAYQLQALGVSDAEAIDPQSSLGNELMNLYELMGNVLARQYGGSEAHSTIFKKQRGDWETLTAIMDKLTSLRRYYNNAYTDAEKQDALNLFLGNYIPVPGQPAIWELESDHYLHSGLGQRFLRRFWENAELSSDDEECSDSGPSKTSPSTTSGHCRGEGVLHHSSSGSGLRKGGLGSEGSSNRLLKTRNSAETNQGLDSSPCLDNAASQEHAGDSEQEEASSEGEYEDDAYREGGVQQSDEAHSSNVKVKHDGPANSNAPKQDKSSRAVIFGIPLPLSFLQADALSAGGSTRSKTTRRASKRTARTPLTMMPSGQTPRESCRLPSAVSVHHALEVLKGIKRFKPQTYGDTPKLESFDRKFGQPANAISEVRIQVPDRSNTSFLPLWLTSPLGFSASAPVHALQRRAKEFSFPETTPALGKPALQRHSADAVRGGLRSTGKPLFRSISEAGQLSQRQEVPGEVAQSHRTLDLSSAVDLDLKGVPAIFRGTAEEVTNALLAMPLITDLSEGDGFLDCFGESNLGMSSGLHHWWSNHSTTEESFLAGEEREQTALQRMARSVDQLYTLPALETVTAEYSHLCTVASQ